MNSTDLSALMGSRICHDLISPLGAISNGIELMQLSGMDSPETTLISEAVEHANLKIRFFRIAFGAASDAQMVAANEIAKVLTPEGFSTKLKLDWQAPGDLPRQEVKLAFLALQCLESAMPYGGQIAVTGENGCWRLKGTAERLKYEPELWAALGVDACTTLPAPAHLHFALLGPELRARGRRAEINASESQISLSF
ncbi:MAG: histidine phosphotransferase [Rhodobacteraceae bacterium]|nr:histidine phosphotransferase [Paracoccaceae bacterium]